MHPLQLPGRRAPGQGQGKGWTGQERTGPHPFDPAMEASLKDLTARARKAAARSHVPFSGRPKGAVLLLSDGHWVPGCRIESAVLPLAITALQAAIAAAIAAGRRDVVAAVLSCDADATDDNFIKGGPFSILERVALNAYLVTGKLSTARAPLPIHLAPSTVKEGMMAARLAANRAYTPVSGFAVGCAGRTNEGMLVTGVNVEHEDWQRMLCAERSLLAIQRSWGLPELAEIFIACIHADTSSPCGACRQLLVELAPHATIWMDRSSGPPWRSSPKRLLPRAFGWHPDG